MPYSLKINIYSSTWSRHTIHYTLYLYPLSIHSHPRELTNNVLIMANELFESLPKTGFRALDPFGPPPSKERPNIINHIYRAPTQHNWYTNIKLCHDTQLYTLTRHDFPVIASSGIFDKHNTNHSDQNVSIMPGICLVFWLFSRCSYLWMACIFWSKHILDSSLLAALLGKFWPNPIWWLMVVLVVVDVSRFYCYFVFAMLWLWSLSPSTKCW